MAQDFFSILEGLEVIFSAFTPINIVCLLCLFASSSILPPLPFFGDQVDHGVFAIDCLTLLLVRSASPLTVFPSSAGTPKWPECAVNIAA
jgi:hypothetical protein